MRVQLFAGQETSINRAGWFFRLLTAESAVDVRIVRNVDGKEFYRGTLSAGLGINFLSNARAFMGERGQLIPYDTIFLKSEVDQAVDIWSELVQVDDDRLSGNFDINAALTVAQTAAKQHSVAPVQTVTSAGVEVLPARKGRKTALVQVSAAVYMASQNGVEVGAGESFQWDNESALTLYAKSADAKVRINEDFD